MIAVGTTVVRTLETVVDNHGEVHAGSGWTETVVTPTGWCGRSTASSRDGTSPRHRIWPCWRRSWGGSFSSGRTRRRSTERYLWHEFGDVHLVLP